MQECRSSSMSRCLSAYWAHRILAVLEAERWESKFVKRRRTSKGSAMVDETDDGGWIGRGGGGIELVGESLSSCLRRVSSLPSRVWR